MKAWCPTKVDDSGNAMIEQGYWGYCQPECAISTSGLWENKPDTTTPSTTCGANILKKDKLCFLMLITLFSTLMKF